MDYRIIRRTLPFTAAAAILYLGWVAAVRYGGDRRMEQRTHGRAARSDTAAPGAAGTAVRIGQFYANSGEVTRGSHAVVCYGVENARAVRLEPPVDELKPALNRCFAVSPRETTTYTLHADGFDGTAAAASFTVHVSPPPPRILFVHLSSNEMKRGSKWTMCYGVADTVRAVFEPVNRPLPIARKHCMQTYLVRSGTYSLVAYGEDGRADREKFDIKVW